MSVSRIAFLATGAAAAATLAPGTASAAGMGDATLSAGLTDKDPYYLVATLKFASVDAIKSSLGSATGAAVVADLKNFAQAGVDIMVFENVPA